MIIIINQEQIQVNHFGDLNSILAKYPLEKECIFNQFISNPNIFYFIRSIDTLREVCESFPDQKDAIYNRVLGDLEISPYFVNTLFDLATICKIFPNKKEIIFNQTLGNAGVSGELCK
jgi:hypothetical protein